MKEAQRIKERRTESTRSTDSAKESVKYAVHTDNKGRKYWEIDTEKDIFKGLKTKEEFRDAAFNFLIGNRDNNVVYEDKNGKKIKFIRISAQEFTRSKESTEYYKNAPETFNKKMRLIPSLKDLLLNYSVEWHSKDHKAHKLFKDNGFHNYRGRVKIDDVVFDYIVRVGKTDTDNIFYDINLEANYYLPHTQSASDMASNDDSVSQKSETVNTHSMQNGEKYAVSDDSGAEKITVKDVRAVQSVGRKSVNDFTSEDIKKTGGFARRYFKEMGEKSPFFRAWFGDWRANDTTKKGAVRGKTKNLDTSWEVQISGKIFNETKSHNQSYNVNAQPYLDYINSIVENAVLLDSYAIPENKAKSPNSVMMHSLYAVADMGNGREILKLYIEELNDVNADGTMKRAYQLQNIENQQSGVQGSGKNLSPITQTADVNTVSQLFDLVKQKDENFNPKASSKIVNEDGTPKVVYHGTSEKFTVFDRTKGRSNMDIQGMFFSPWEIDARGYGGNVGEYYLSIKNPAPEGIAYKALNMFAGQNYAGIKAREYLEKLGYDGVNNSDEEYIAFYPNQIKSATDNIGTFDPGNDDTHYAVSDEETGDDRWKKIEDAERGLKSADETVQSLKRRATNTGRS